MNERPILFSGPMIRAILEGRKTQTRRVVKPQPTEQVYQIYKSADFAPRDPLDDQAPDFNREIHCSYGAPGDRLWVRETHAIVPMTAYRASEGVQQTINPNDPNDAAIYRAGWDRSDPGVGWRPSIHMPRWASRITLELTGVRVERVQDITTTDVLAEGVAQYTLARGALADPPHDPRWKFTELWDSINAARGYDWASNPWVWVLEFRRVS